MTAPPDADNAPPQGVDLTPPDDALVRVVEIVNSRGLHARASAKFVQTVEKFDAYVTVTRGAETVGGNSIMGLMMLSAGPGTSITITAWGREAQAVLAALEALVCERFGEQG
jgi:phosphocarrier protein HPr